MPQSIEELALTVVDRVLDLAGLKIKSKRWQQD
jgi:3-polyprenyl-4-hydroxybenzoate decarboxylase